MNSASGDPHRGRDGRLATSIALPRVGYGCASLGGSNLNIDAKGAEAVLDAAWEFGVRYFDTAPWYGNTLSEHRVGAFLRDKPRHEYILTTKVGRLYQRPPLGYDFASSPLPRRWPGGLQMVPSFDYTYDGIIRSYEDSIQRLGITRFDALTIHDLDTRHHPANGAVDAGLRQLTEGGGYRALEELKSAGEIDAVGVGINLAGFIPRFLERFPIDYFILAAPYTLLDQTSLAEDLPLCAKHAIQVVAGAPFASGILATGARTSAQFGYKNADRDILERVAAIEAICSTHDVSLASAAIQFPLAHPCVSTLLFGADTPEQLNENLTHLNSPIPAQFWHDLVSAGLLDASAPVPAEGQMSEKDG